MNAYHDDSRVKKPTVLVIDAMPSDYIELVASSAGDGLRFRFLQSGRAALRISRPSSVDLLIVNVHLPDMSGFDLCEMLQSQFADVPVYLVSDQYCAEDELRARSIGATLYVCKPLQPAWISSLCRPPPLTRDPPRSARHSTPMQ